MGILIRWRKVENDSPYNKTEVYKATTQLGTYSLLDTVPSNDLKYYDADGLLTSWYKVRFKDSTSLRVSDYSDALQGGKWVGYCSVKDVRLLSNITPNMISDTLICELIEQAGVQLNSDISVYNEEEVISFIDSLKDNDVDGTNTTFYTIKYPIGDIDDNMIVDTSDVIVYTYDSTGETRTQAVVTSITPSTGQFVLDVAPTTDMSKITVTYRSTQLNVSTPDFKVRQACTLLTIAYCYSKLNDGKAPRFKAGGLTVFRDTEAFNKYYNRYRSALAGTNDRSMMDIREAVDLI
jgi:hypothetical protein